MTDKITLADIEKELAYCIGSENFHKWSILFPYRMTDGVKLIADKLGAYWLLDVIASHQLKAKVKRTPFQVWKIKAKDSQAMITCEDGNNNKVSQQKIEYTDFPDGELSIWFQNNTLFVPSEY